MEEYRQGIQIGAACQFCGERYWIGTVYTRLRAILPWKCVFQEAREWDSDGLFGGHSFIITYDSVEAKDEAKMAPAEVDTESTAVGLRLLQV